MKPFVIMACICILAWNAHAQSLRGDTIDAYELAVPATFAITLSQAKTLNQGPADAGAESFTLTSTNIVKYLGLPKAARCYWVFDFESKSSVVAGALVIANKQTGEIYEEFAYGFGITLFDLIDGGVPGSESVGVIFQDQNDISIILNIAMTWNLGEDVAPIATFGRFALQISGSGGKSTVSLHSLSDLAGDGVEQKGLMVTGGRLEAKGEVLEVTP